MSQDSKYAIKTSLESYGFVEDMQIYTECFGERVNYEHTAKLMGCLNGWYYEDFGNKDSQKYIQNVEKRVDTLKQLCFQWLICKGYESYWMENKLPLVVEYYILLHCDLMNSIGLLCKKRIENEAKFHQITYYEMMQNVKMKHKYMGWNK